jgi:hypothetical protein
VGSALYQRTEMEDRCAGWLACVEGGEEEEEEGGVRG